ncbi:MAG: radical SAM protein [Oscillospiraceae bacterium]|nr:radical SAM protein [Oscillospiraceae bacterium]
MDDILGLLRHCTLCPRQCGVNRLAGQKGFCGLAGEHVRLARAALHFWEEPCISGTEGSGTVFFSGCTLRCSFCQNREISRGEAGKEIPIRRLADIYLELQQKGARNINLVTPTHYLPQILVSLRMAREEGLTLPVVYNTSGYELPERLRLLEGMVDVYLPDMKYLSPQLAGRLSAAADYPGHILPALDEMVRQTGEADFDENGMIRRGVIVRHLALPGQGSDSRAVLRTLLERYGNKIWISIMNQYTPPPFPLPDEDLNRRLTAREYDRLLDYALRHGAENAFIQEGGTAEESFIPPFDLEGV